MKAKETKMENTLDGLCEKRYNQIFPNRDWLKPFRTILIYNSDFSVSTVVRSYGGALKAPAALLRLRVYQACYALGGGGSPPPAPLLRLLAAELAGSADPSGANVATGKYW